MLINFNRMITDEQGKTIEERLYVLLHRADDQLAYHNYPYAESLLLKARALLSETSDVGIVLHHNDIACRLAIAKMDFTQALNWCKSSLNLTEEPLIISKTSFMAAQCLFYIKGRETEVIKYCDDAIKYANMVDKQDAFKTEPMRYKAIVAFESGDDDLAMHFINECMRFADDANLPVEKAVSCSLRAKIFERKGKLQLALDDLLRAERYVKEDHDYNHYCRIAIQRVALMFKMGLDEQAKEVILAIAKDKDIKRI